MSTLAEPDVNVKLLKERHRIEKARKTILEDCLRMSERTDSLTFVFCTEPGCDWEKQCENVNSAMTSAHGHAEAKGHTVAPWYLIPGPAVRPKPKRSIIDDVRR